MSDFFPERIEPLGPVGEPLNQQKNRDSSGGNRRRKSPPAPQEVDIGDDENDERHQLDRIG